MTIPRKSIVIAGGSGFLGQALAAWFNDCNWNVVVLSRHAEFNSPAARFVVWDGRTVSHWAQELEQATALVNLAGLSVNCRYHAHNRRAILNSRIESTRVLGEAIARCLHPPRVWLNSSTATIYKHSLDQPMDESTGVISGTPTVKDVFSVDVAQRWEQALFDAHTPDTRKVALRTAMVLGTQPCTVYRVLRRLARLGLGGPMSGGGQYMSWIHQIDFCRSVAWLIEHPEVSGPVNLAAPQPVTNADMMRVMRAICGMPIGLPATRWMLELGAFFLRTETELIIKSRRVVPGLLTEGGFRFRYPELSACVADLERRLLQHVPHDATDGATLDPTNAAAFESSPSVTA